jgi:hypothetical protein
MPALPTCREIKAFFNSLTEEQLDMHLVVCTAINSNGEGEFSSVDDFMVINYNTPGFIENAAGGILEDNQPVLTIC